MMAVTLREDIDREIKETFERDASQSHNRDEEIRDGFREHKNTLTGSGMSPFWKPISNIK